MASPPEAGTRKIRPPPSGAKTIRFCEPQLPPRWSGASASSRAGPPARSTRFSFFSAKKPTERPSGEKKGASAPSVPGRAFGSRSSRVPDVEPRLAVGAGGREGDPSPVGRDVDGARGHRAGRRQHRQLQRGHRGRPRASPEERPRRGGRDRERRHRPGDESGRPPRRGDRGRGGRRVFFLRQLDPRVGDVVQPLLRVLPQAAPEKAADPRRDPRGKRVEVGGRLQDRRQDVGEGLALEEPAAGEHLVEHDAEGPDVGPLVDGLAAGLLGGHVGGGAEDEPGRGAGVGEGGGPRQVGGGRARRPSPVQALARPKSRTLTLPSGRDLDVRGLEVAVDDALLVRGLERLRDLLRDGERLVERQRPALQPLGEVLAFDQLQHEEELARPPPRGRGWRRCRGG